MCVDAGVSQRADHGVCAPIRIFNLFGQTNICHVDSVAFRTDTHEQIVCLGVSMDVSFRINVLKARDELIRKQQHSLTGELPIALVKDDLQA